MPRQSAEKIINSQSYFDKYLPEYLSILDNLQNKYTVTTANDFKDLVNFKTNKIIPKHNWFEYKQGYSEELVNAILEKEKPDISKYVLDPFCGVGTTNLVSQSKGYKSIGFDINPVAFLASSVKTKYYNSNDIDLINLYINNFNTKHYSKFKETAKVVLSSFTENSLKQLLTIKGYLENEIKESEIYNFFLLAFLSIIEDCSIRIKDGNGIKLKKDKKQIENIFEYYLIKCKQMLADISNSNYEPEVKLFNNSLFDNKKLNLENESVSICIYSPPYANCFDYCEVYKLEFWFGNFVKTYDEFKKYRNIAMRSHVNSQFSHKFENSNKEVDIIAKLLSTFNLWNKNIPDMVRGYFDDTQKLLSVLKNYLTKNAKVYIVVANSGYKGILVPTDLLIAEIAEKLNYKVNNILLARKIRASSQQMTELHGQYDNLMRESIIELQNL